MGCQYQFLTMEWFLKETIMMESSVDYATNSSPMATLLLEISKMGLRAAKDHIIGLVIIKCILVIG